MGDDGNPRRVLETVSGRESMWEIRPDHAPSFSVLLTIC